MNARQKIKRCLSSRKPSTSIKKPSTNIRQEVRSSKSTPKRVLAQS